MVYLNSKIAKVKFQYRPLDIPSSVAWYVNTLNEASQNSYMGPFDDNGCTKKWISKIHWVAW